MQLLAPAARAQPARRTSCCCPTTASTSATTWRASSRARCPTRRPAFETASARAAEVSAALEGILAQDLILPPDGFWDRRDANRVARAAARRPTRTCWRALPDGHPLRALYTLPARFGADLSTTSARSAWRASPICTGAAPSASTAGARACAPAARSPEDPLGRGAPRPACPRRSWSSAARSPACSSTGAARPVGCTHVLCGMGADRVARSSRGRREAAQAAGRGGGHHAGGVALPLAPGGAARRAARRARAARLRGRAIRRSRSTAPTRWRCTSPTATASTPCSRVEALADRSRRPRRCARCATACAQHLDALLPFVDRHLLLVHSPHDGMRARGRRRRARLRRRRRCRWSRCGRCRGDRPLGFCGLPHATGHQAPAARLASGAARPRPRGRAGRRLGGGAAGPADRAQARPGQGRRLEGCLHFLLAVFARAKMVHAGQTQDPRRAQTRAPRSFVAAVKQRSARRAAGAGAEPRPDGDRAQAAGRARLLPRTPVTLAFELPDGGDVVRVGAGDRSKRTPTVCQRPRRARRPPRRARGSARRRRAARTPARSAWRHVARPGDARAGCRSRRSCASASEVSRRPASAPMRRTASAAPPASPAAAIVCAPPCDDHALRRTRRILTALVAAERLLDLGEQVVDLERLGHVEARADVDAVDHAARIGLRGQEDDRDLLRLAVAP